MRVFVEIACLASFLGSLAFGCSSEASSEDTDYIVGALLPFTGALSQANVGIENGAALALEDVNSAGGVNGRLFRFEKADSRTTPAGAVKGADFLLKKNISVILGAVSSSATIAAFEKTRPMGTLLVSPASQADSLTAQDNNGLFLRISPTTSAQAEVLAKRIFADGYERVGIVSSTQAYAASWADSLTREFTSLQCDSGPCSSVRVDYDENEDFGSYDFAADIRNILAKEPDALFFSGLTTDGLGQVDAALRAGYEGLLYMGLAVAGGDIALVLSPEAVKRIRFPAVSSDTEKAGDYWERRYTSAHGELSAADALARQSFDATMRGCPAPC